MQKITQIKQIVILLPFEFNTFDTFESNFPVLGSSFKISHVC